MNADLFGQASEKPKKRGMQGNRAKEKMPEQHLLELPEPTLEEHQLFAWRLAHDPATTNAMVSALKLSAQLHGHLADDANKPAIEPEMTVEEAREILEQIGVQPKYLQ